MIPPCAIINDKVLPVIRALVSRQLVDDGWSQSRIARELEISQAMVSKYLSKDTPSVHYPELDLIAGELASLIKRGAERSTRVGLMCQWCFNHKEGGHLCEHHPVPRCAVCMNLRSREEVGERHQVISDLTEALTMLQSIDIEIISPQVRINIAQAVPGAETTMDVASIPGRLVPMGNGIRTLAPPEFGVSGHLAGLLLQIAEKDRSVRAVMNIRFDTGIAAAMKKYGLRVIELDRLRFPGMEDFIRSTTWKAADVLVDPGDFGLEPCTYILAASAPHLVGKIQGIMEHLPIEDKETRR